MGSDETVTVRQAAALAGVSIDTIRRRLRENSLEDASRPEHPNEPWRIPVQSLVHAGLFSMTGHTEMFTGPLPVTRAETISFLYRLRDAVSALLGEIDDAIVEAGSG